MKRSGFESRDMAVTFLYWLIIVTLVVGSEQYSDDNNDKKRCAEKPGDKCRHGCILSGLAKVAQR